MDGLIDSRTYIVLHHSISILSISILDLDKSVHDAVVCTCKLCPSRPFNKYTK